MKNLILLLLVVLTSTLFSCKKKDVEPNVTNVTNYVVTDYVSAIPLYSVKIHNDTLTCDAENNIYEYVKINNTQFKNLRVYWKSTSTWTTWNENKISYLSGNTLYITF